MDPADLAKRIYDARGSRLIPGASAQVSALIGKSSDRLGELIMRKAVFDKLK